MASLNQTSFLMNIFVNATPKPIDSKCMLPLVHGIPIAIINSVFALVGTFGNFLIIFAVLNTPKLRQRVSNFLLLSLAVADLLVTMLAQPLHATSISFKTFCNYCVPEVDFAYDIAGNFSCFCSIFHLSAISIDRALVVTKPHQHHAMMTRYGLKLMLGVCWGVAAVFVCLRVPFPSTLMLSIALIVFNYIIIIVSYAIILWQITREKVISKDPAAALSQTSGDAVIEKRVARAIGIIILFFTICWFPLLGFYISVQKAVLRDLGSLVYMWFRTLALSNSSMNFIIYSLRIDHFRVAYMRIINRVLRKSRNLFGISQFKMTSSAASRGSKDNLELGSRVEGSNLGNTQVTKLASEEICKEAISVSGPKDACDISQIILIPAQVNIDTKKDTRERGQEDIGICNITVESPTITAKTHSQENSE